MQTLIECSKYTNQTLPKMLTENRNATEEIAAKSKNRWDKIPTFLQQALLEIGKTIKMVEVQTPITQNNFQQFQSVFSEVRVITSTLTASGFGSVTFQAGEAISFPVSVYTKGNRISAEAQGTRFLLKEGTYPIEFTAKAFGFDTFSFRTNLNNFSFEADGMMCHHSRVIQITAANEPISIVAQGPSTLHNRSITIEQKP